MNPETWAAVDRYINDRIVPADPVLEAALAASAAAGLPAINVSAPQGKLLQLLARMQSARRILEIGTLGGYSTIWLARALPDDGRIVTLELEAKHAEVARANFSRAGVAPKIELRLGRAIDSLEALIAEKVAPFDLVFIDADKASIPEYFAASLKLSRPGTAIVVDNVVRKGALADGSTTDDAVRGVQRFHELLARETRVSATTIQTVGSKGYDGFTLAIVGA
jgi:predicted O-methyltransferase YrrM